MGLARIEIGTDGQTLVVEAPSTVAVCPTAEELLNIVWSEIAARRLHGPVDDTSLLAPSLGDFGASLIYRSVFREVAGEIIVPVYAAHFEGEVEGERLHDVVLAAAEEREGVRVVAVDVSARQFIFEAIAPGAGRDSIVRWLPGMGGEWNKRNIGNEPQPQGLSMTQKTLRSFIVHGHAEKDKWELKNYLQNTLGLDEPVILHEQPSLGRTIMEKFEEHAAEANLVFVLLTGDDTVAAADATDDSKRRARQNVIFEMGYFLGLLSRRAGRVILLHQGALELPSDIVGVVYLDISKGVRAAGEDIRREIQHLVGPR